MHDRLRALGVMLAFGVRAGRRQWLTLLLAEVVGPLAGLAGAYATKLLTDGVLQRSLVDVQVAAVISALSVLLVNLCSRVYVSLVVQNAEQAGQDIDRQLMGLTTSIPGLEHHERPEFADELELVRSQRHLLSRMTNAVVLNLRVWISLVGGAVLLSQLHPLLVLLPLFGLGSMVTGRRANAILQQTEEANAERDRLRHHLFNLTTSLGPAKELRVFGLEDEVVARHRAVTAAMMRDAGWGACRRIALEVVGSLCFAAGYVGSIALVLLRAVQGLTTPGDVLLAVVLAAQMNRTIADVVDMGNYLSRVLKVARRYIWLVDYARRARHGETAPGVAGRSAAIGIRTPPTTSTPPALPAPVPEHLTRGVAIERLSFAYPHTDTPVLEGVSLRLPAGAVVALVGENGAGKTTLVKLLGRFYDPDAGRILVDAVDLRRLDA
ncbi:MAG TPA: ABC transporter ATP-binding protein, partial [Chloroflexota bacterium]|nr:ABC transporter ATP-binding protein [Chloroflexota bacterium]